MSPAPPGEKLKRCSSCGLSKPPSEFWKNKSTKDGLQRQCKPCLLECQRKSKEAKLTAANAAPKKFAPDDLDGPCDPPNGLPDPNAKPAPFGGALPNVLLDSGPLVWL